LSPAEPTREEALDAALAALGAKPYHPVYAPLPAPAGPPVKPLPDPMEPSLRKRLLGGATAPEKPDMHGCAYFDDGCPWNICYACEYEKDPEAYEQKILHSNLIKLISAYWRSPAVGERARHWETYVLEDVVAELDRPKDQRMCSDAEVAMFNVRGDYYHDRKAILLQALAELNA
jgi:hypothetical protein